MLKPTCCHTLSTHVNYVSQAHTLNMNIPPLAEAECEHTLSPASLPTITIPDVVSYFTTALPKLGSFYVCVCLNSVLYLWRSVHSKRAGSTNFANTKARRLQVPRVAEVQNILVGPKHISMHCLFSC